MNLLVEGHAKVIEDEAEAYQGETEQGERESGAKRRNPNLRKGKARLFYPQQGRDRTVMRNIALAR